VDDGSAAWQAGLRVDDAVIRINGQNVSRSIADSVAKIVRLSEKQIVLDIHRQTKEVNNEGQKVTSENRRSMYPENGLMSRDANRQSLLLSSDESSTDLSGDISSDLFIDIGDWEPPRLPNIPSPSIRIRFQELSEEEQNRQLAIQELFQLEKIFIKKMQFGIDRYSSPLRHKFVSPAEHLTLFQNLEQLVSISEYHVHKLQESRISYSDINDQEHMFTDVLGSIYLSKV
jgi:regulator of G-protein signaling 3